MSAMEGMGAFGGEDMVREGAAAAATLLASRRRRRRRLSESSDAETAPPAAQEPATQEPGVKSGPAGSDTEVESPVQQQVASGLEEEEDVPAEQGTPPGSPPPSGPGTPLGPPPPLAEEGEEEEAPLSPTSPAEDLEDLAPLVSPKELGKQSPIASAPGTMSERAKALLKPKAAAMPKAAKAAGKGRGKVAMPKPSAASSSAATPPPMKRQKIKKKSPSERCSELYGPQPNETPTPTEVGRFCIVGASTNFGVGVWMGHSGPCKPDMKTSG